MMEGSGGNFSPQSFSSLPFADLNEIAPGTSLILAPHPDDETLGCGGLIARACDHLRPPVIVAVTDGAASHPGSPTYPPARLKRLRRAELQAAVKILGGDADRIHHLDLPDGNAPMQGEAFDRAIQQIAAIVQAYEVTTIFATWRHDPHCDHEATARIAEQAARIAGVRLKFYPVWGWLLPPDSPVRTERLAGARLDIGNELERKRRAIAAHASQYSHLIDDDPNGFRLPAELLSVFDRPFEVYLDR